MFNKIKGEIQRLHVVFLQRAYVNPELERDITTSFNKLYYDLHILNKTWASTSFLGIGIDKCISDLWIYQEILSERAPDVIIECGTGAGGSTLYLVSLCDLIGNGKVISIDINERQGRPQHDRIAYLLGSSRSDKIVRTVRNSVKKTDRVMVILDSDHSRNHVLAEMKIYGTFVTPNDYMIVEDTNVNGHPVVPDFGPGPMEAVSDFLKECSDFAVDREKEKFLVTFNPGGYLKKTG